MTTSSAREEILLRTRAALRRDVNAPVAPIPASALFVPRTPGEANSEIEMLLSEIAKLGGKTRQIAQKDEFAAALQQLARAENIKKATLWQTPELNELGVGAALRALGVEIVSPHSDKYVLAECDLGVTSVDAALPETGTLLLRSAPEKPRLVSLLPRVHLAMVSPAVLRADLGPALAEVKGEGYWIFITGPSRTADIELTLTIGVHGPKALYVWAWEK